MKIHFKPDQFISQVSHQKRKKRKFSVLCTKRYKSFNLEVHVGVDVLQPKLPVGSVTESPNKLTFERLRS